MTIEQEATQKALAKLMVWIEGEAKKLLYANQELVNKYDGDRDGDNRMVQDIAQSLYTKIEQNSGILATPLEEAFWYEYGTGGYSLNGKGRYGYWVYVDEDVPGQRKATIKVAYTEEEALKCKAYLVQLLGVADNKVHVSNGSEAKPFLSPIINDRADEVNEMFNKFFTQALAEVMAKRVKGVTVKNGG